jgi:hypothetical protein
MVQKPHSEQVARKNWFLETYKLMDLMAGVIVVAARVSAGLVPDAAVLFRNSR